MTKPIEIKTKQKNKTKKPADTRDIFGELPSLTIPREDDRWTDSGDGEQPFEGDRAVMEFLEVRVLSLPLSTPNMPKSRSWGTTFSQKPCQKGTLCVCGNNVLLQYKSL